MYEIINEPIEVFANFTNKGPEPICFSWKNNDYDISTINFKHLSKKGNTTLVHFAVTAKDNTYKITFNPDKLLWNLDEVYFIKNFKHTFSVNESKKKHLYKYK